MIITIHTPDVLFWKCMYQNNYIASVSLENNIQYSIGNSILQQGVYFDILRILSVESTPGNTKCTYRLAIELDIASRS